MTTTEYAAPSAGGDNLPLADLLGALLRIDVLAAEENMTTSFGLANPIRANVVALDGARKGESYDDTLIFPRVLVSSLKPNVGKVVLGRLGKGVAKPGQSAPWTLSAPTEDDIAVARKYDAHVAEKTAKQEEPW